MERDPQRPFVKNIPIPDDAPEDPPLTAREAGRADPANRQAYDEADRQPDHVVEAQPEPEPRR